jgi:hypothetical protein
MKKIFLMTSVMILISTCVFAGVMNLNCKNKTGTILMNTSGVGAIGQIEIHHNRAGKKEIYKGEVVIMSGHDDKCQFPEKIICAIPVGNSKSISEDCKQMHVVRDNGFDCLGQKMWRIENQQNYILTTASGNIQDSFTCTNEGFTSPRGCFADRDFRLIEWHKIDCDDFK